MLAYRRDDLVEAGEYPPSNPMLSHEEWDKGLYFEVLCSHEFETEEGFNILALHPEKGTPILLNSIDLEYKHYHPKVKADGSNNH